MICLIMKILYNTFIPNYTHSLITLCVCVCECMFLRVEAFDCLLMMIIKKKGKATFSANDKELTEIRDSLYVSVLAKINGASNL